MEKVQKRALRIALQVKKQTPTWKLMEIVNGKSMTDKLKELQIKMWHKYKRAPDYLLQHWTFKQWKNYIETNDRLSVDDKGIMTINPARLNYIAKSPLSRAYNLVKSLYQKDKNIMIQKRDSVMKPPPVYTIKYPTNININNNENKMKNDHNNNIIDLNKIANSIANHQEGDIFNLYHFDFFTDGACIPNPGPGGCAYFSLNFSIKSKIYVVDHDTSINYCELFGIKLVLQSVKNFIDYCQENNLLLKVNYINVFTDSKFVCDILNICGYPKYDYYYKLIIQIFKLCKELEYNNIYININKINSHIGIAGNEKADKLAKEAANLARECKFGGNKLINYNCNKNPVQIDIEKDLIKLRIQRKKSRKMKLIEEKNIANIVKMSDEIEHNQNENRKNKKMNYSMYDYNNFFDDDDFKRYRGGNIFINALVHFDLSIANRTNKMRKELEFLNQRECEIIMKLRTEYINLNQYLYHIHFHPDGKCEHCGVVESVSHFLIDCVGFKKEEEKKKKKDKEKEEKLQKPKEICVLIEPSKSNKSNESNSNKDVNDKDKVDFTIARKQMRKRLKGIAIFFKHEKNFNSTNILFPHIWQGNPKRDKDFKKNEEKFLEKRISILKTVINYVDRTRRFKNDFGI